MPLNAKESKQLQDALLDAFAKPELTQLVRFALGQDLDQIAGGATTKDIVFNLIDWVERNNATADLVRGALAQNPANNRLRTFADQYLAERRAVEQPDLGRPASNAAGTPPEGPGTEERAAPLGPGDNHASGGEMLQIIANVAQILGLAVAFVALVVTVRGPAAWTQATFGVAAVAFLLSAAGFLYLQRRRGRLTKLAGALLALLLVLAVAIGASAVLVCCAPPQREVPPDVSLVSMRFEVGDWNPRLVDLRHAAESGIPVGEGDHLELSDFWIAVPKYAPGYVVQVEVYQNEQLTETLGYTDWKPLDAGTTNLGSLTTTGKSEYRPGVWKAPAEWIGKPLYIALVTYRSGVDKPVAAVVTKLLLNPQGTAWIKDPPNASFAGVTYSVNGTSAEALDQTNAVEMGIRAAPGDHVAIRSVWFRSNMSGGEIRAEAYVTDDGYKDEYVRYSDPAVTQASTTEEIPDTSQLEWLVPQGFTQLVLRLVRDDGAILDSLVLPLSGYGGADGMVQTSQAVRWPFAEVEYVDLEDPAELATWERTPGTQIALSTAQAFSAKSSLAITRTEGTGDGGVVVKWHHPFQARLIVGQIYWPGPGASMPSWAQVCIDGAAECFGALDKTQGDRWQVFVIDLANVCAEHSEGGDCTRTVDLSGNRYDGLYLQGGFEAAPDTPYTFYVDGLQIYGSK